MSARLTRFASWRLDRAARRDMQPQQCNAVSPTFESESGAHYWRAVCVRAPGHSGQHQGGDTAWWSDRWLS